MKIVSGNSNRPLADEVVKHLGLNLTQATFRHFTDHELFIEIQENVRGEDIFLVQSTSCPANDNLMELLIALDALKRGSAKRITAVLPYFGYARQDRKTSPRSPISAKLVANLLTVAGATRILTFDLHSAQIQGFFDIPVDNLFSSPVFASEIQARYGDQSLMLVSPDVGGVARARSLAKRVGADLAIVDKRRDKPGQSEVMNIVGSVEGRTCILVDDIVDSGGTLCQAAAALKQAGATSVSAYITHGVLSGNAVETINKSCLEELVITNSIQPTALAEASPKIRIVSIAPMLADAMQRIADNRSVSCLFA